MIITEVATRRSRRALTAGVLAVAVGGVIAGCSGDPAQHSNSPVSPSSPPGANAQPGHPDVALCRGYLAASGDARAPLSAMRTEAVLVPTVDFIELGANQMATKAAGARSPIIAAAMREVVAAQEDLDTQGHQKLPAGADLNTTAVMLNPDRLSAALDAADLACKPPLSGKPKPA